MAASHGLGGSEGHVPTPNPCLDASKHWGYIRAPTQNIALEYYYCVVVI